MKIITILLALFIWPLWINAESQYEISITQLQEYAKKFSEYPKPDRMDWLYPEFTSFYQSIKPNIFEQILTFFNIKQPVPWVTDSLLRLTQAVLKQQNQKNMVQESVTLLDVDKDTQVYIWAPLHGAWHSLIRDLNELKNKNVIDDMLHILPENCFFIFMANAYDRFAYGIETLYTILMLLSKNPDKVLYIRTNHESPDSWEYTIMGYELNIRYRANLKNIKSALTAFFTNLPQAIYLIPKFNPQTIIQVSPEGILEGKIIAPEKLKNLIAQKISSGNINPIITSVIRDESDIRIANQETPGLRLLPPDQYASAWALISSPTNIYQKFANFFQDSFVKLVIKKPFAKSTITHIHRNVRKDNENFIYDVFNLSTGRNITQETTEIVSKIFNIGSTMALTKGAYTIGQEVRSGMSFSIQQYNQTTTHNFFLKPHILDDQYLPMQAKKNIQELLDKNIKTILLPIGSATLAAYINHVKDKAITVFFPVTGDIRFRSSDLSENIIYWRASYVDEAKALISYLTTTHKPHKIAFFYQNDAYGQEPLAAAHEALKQHNIKWFDLPYEPNALDFTQQAEKLKKEQPDTICLFSMAAATEELIRHVGIEFFVNVSLFGISFLSEPAFKDFLLDQGITVVFAQVVPNPHTSTLPIIQDYRKIADQKGYQYNVYSLEAYITTNIFIEGINNVKKAKEKVTGNSILHALKKFNNVQFKGFNLNYDPEYLSLNRYVWLDNGKDKEWQKIDVNSLENQINGN